MALGPVLLVGGEVEPLEVGKRGVHLREEGAGDLRGEPIGKDLLGPYIVEPGHGDEVAEPHVGGLMGDEFGPGQEVVHGRIRIQEDALVGELDGAGMFHAAELVARDGDEVVFLEREGDARVILHPAHGRGGLAEHLRNLGKLVRIGLPEVEVHRKAVDGFFRHLPLAGDEGEEVGWDGLCIVEYQLFTSFNDRF